MYGPLLSRYRELVREGSELAVRLEQGQANCALAELFARLARAPEEDGFTAVMIGVTPEARTAALKWLYGPEYAVVSVLVVEKLGLIEIRLSERGFMLEHGGGARLFDQLDPFIEALSRADEIQHPRISNWMAPVRLGLSSGSGIQGITLLVPEKPALLGEHAALLSRLSTRANLLLVAAPLHHELSDADRRALEALAASMDGVWPLLVVDELSDSAALPAHGWWERLAAPAALSLPPKLLTTHVPAAMSALLSEQRTAHRQGLFVAHQARRLDGASEALSAELEQRLRQMDTRIHKEERKARAADGDNGSVQGQRGDWQKLRQDAQLELPALARQFGERLRTGGKTHGIDGLVERFLANLVESDLHKEQGHSSIRLSVSETFIQQLMDLLRKGLQKQLAAEAGALRAPLADLHARLQNRATTLAGVPARLSSAVIDDAQIWRDIQGQLDVRLRYRGEMPRRGFFDRLREGRQGAMSFMMMIGMAGMIFGSTALRQNPLVGLVLLLVFVGSVVLSFINWRRDDEERIGKELEKLRDGVSGEVQRLSAELQREMQSKVAERLEQLKREWGEALDLLAERHVRERQRQTDAERQQARDRLRLLEQQKRDLAALHTGIRQIRQKAAQLLRDCLHGLKSAGAAG